MQKHLLTYVTFFLVILASMLANGADSLKPISKLRTSQMVIPSKLMLGLHDDVRFVYVLWNSLVIGVVEEQDTLGEGVRKRNKVLMPDVQDPSRGFDASLAPNWISMALMGQLAIPAGASTIRFIMKPNKFSVRFIYRW